jgi:hypothetical protein
MRAPGSLRFPAFLPASGSAPNQPFERTRSGSRRKAGTWPSGIITHRPYAARLRGPLTSTLGRF